ncbi:hypothetical protein MPSEU_000692800 [Mayamaea pseudoterrestris]|nr:hypothetical protein MPSEU_000692800 [Mayamaea pseudoterrestris]
MNDNESVSASSRASSQPETHAAPAAPPAAAPSASAPAHQYFTKGRSKAAQASPLDPNTLSSVRQAIPLIANHFPGVSSILQQQQSSVNFLLDQSIETLQRTVSIASQKSLTDHPPWVHWSKHDMASPPLKTDVATKLHLTTSQYRGYRMAKASHGVKPQNAQTNMNTMNHHYAASHSNKNTTAAPATVSNMYYFECVIGTFPTAKEIVANLPPNVRLGPKLEEHLRAALQVDEQEQREHDDEPESKKLKVSSSSNSNTNNNNQRNNNYCRIGGHVRLGFSKKTGDVQAPVGYDQWSYAISSAGGIVHASKRQADWNQLYAGKHDTENQLHQHDVVGCAILVNGTDNHIRFFQNGQGLGNFVIARGKREGGEAFSNIEHGTYYPAASIYLGGSVHANFGPYWICPPRKMPPHLKKMLQPVSSLCLPPLDPQEALRVGQAAIQLFARKEHQQALKHAMEIEAQMRCKVYDEYSNNHLQLIRRMRDERGWSVADLPEPSGILSEVGSDVKNEATTFEAPDSTDDTAVAST